MGAQKEHLVLGVQRPVSVCVHVCARAAIIMYTSGIFLAELSPVA